MSADGDGTRLNDLIVISGMSGAGKSLVMNVFEDAGYFCVDNLPPEMIRSLAALFTHPGSKVERACVVCDLRGGEYFERLGAILDDLKREGVAHRLLFLTADEETLVTRYKETRRRHPVAAHEGSVLNGIKRERDRLEPVRERADVLVDTTGMSATMLRRKIAADMLEPASRGRLAVTFLSFGFKNGPARDVDLLLDVRFLPNPHYEPDLRPLTGFDSRVVDHVARDGRLAGFYERAYALLDYLLPNYVTEGKAHLVVGIGCTGGRHRSVTVAEELAARYRHDPRYLVDVKHRDVRREPAPAA